MSKKKKRERKASVTAGKLFHFLMELNPDIAEELALRATGKTPSHLIDGEIIGSIHAHDDIAMPSMKVAAEVIDERGRQMLTKGWSRVHDSFYGDGVLASAAACYAVGSWLYKVDDIGRPALPIWPWAGDQWKPKGRRENLIRAAALIFAEIERMDGQGEASIEEVDNE